jgi:hypothetical protein
LIEKAKSYAAETGKSVSQIVAEYFKLLVSQKQNTHPDSESTPMTKSLRGSLRGSKLDEEDYKKYLEDKHL